MSVKERYWLGHWRQSLFIQSREIYCVLMRWLKKTPVLTGWDTHLWVLTMIPLCSIHWYRLRLLWSQTAVMQNPLVPVQSNHSDRPPISATWSLMEQQYATMGNLSIPKEQKDAIIGQITLLWTKDMACKISHLFCRKCNGVEGRGTRTGVTKPLGKDSPAQNNHRIKGTNFDITT